MKTTAMEAAIGLKRTKGGRDDKELAYLTSKENLKQFGIILIFVASCVLIYGLVLKSDLSYNTTSQTALRKQAVREKSALFASRMEVARTSSEAETKLVKVLSVLQDHLQRDTEDKQALVDFQMSFGNEIKKHKRVLKRELKLLGGNKKVHDYLQEELDMTIDDFYWEVTRNVRTYGEEILAEGQVANARVTLMTQSVLDELEAEGKQEQREARDEAKLEASDSRWKVLASTFRAHSQYSHMESQDQKDVEEMIERFKAK
jgi:hypothetical protein